MINKKEKFAQTLKSLPHKPGVYKFISKDNTVVYVGKAKDLKKRVSQYFQIKQLGPRTSKMLENAESLEFIVVNSELESLILELNLIKELRPKYNILLKDDKNFVYIMISNEDFPSVQIVRKITDKKATYYGPKTAKHKVEKTLTILKKIFLFRHCSLGIKENTNGSIQITNKTIKYPCLDHYIKRCSSPCIGEISKEEYNLYIAQVKRFFEGHTDEIITELKKRMATFAESKQFEKAARIRDQIKNVEEISERQIISDPNQEDKDIINYVIEGSRAFFNLFQVRGGKLINQDNFTLQSQTLEETEISPEILESFLLQYYEKTTNIPKEILIPHDPENKEEIEEFLKNEKGTKVLLKIPQKGQKSHLLELSYKNAKVYAERNRTSWQEEGDHHTAILEELQKLLSLPTQPKRIECYDISHLAGTDTVGSMIVFENGIPNKNMYRKFKIQSVLDKPDDYKSLEEMLFRRLSRLTSVVSAKDFTFKKATKTQTKEIKSLLEKEQLFTEDFDKQLHFYLEKQEGKEKVIAGTLNLLEINATTAEISGLFIKPEYRGSKIGHKLIQNTVLKSKAKRIYIACKKELEDYYAGIGFEPIKAGPKDLEEKCLRCKDTSGNTVWYAIDKRKMKPDESFSRIPDLIVIDGGKGQLSSALKVLNNLKLSLPIISIAKQEEEITTATTPSESQSPGVRQSIKLDHTSPVLKLIQRSRDEAHRFAITFNKQLRGKRMNI